MRNRLPTRCRSRRALRGAAMVEAVVMLPVLGILFVGTGFARERAVARQHAMLEARRCAWEDALAGCDPHRVPESCKKPPAQGQSPEGGKESGELIASVDHPQNSFNPLDDVPLLGEAMRALFGTTTTASSSIDVPSPWTAGASFAARGEITVTCNEHPHGVREVIKDAVGTKLPKAAP